jgi:hypothetical protein
MAFRCHLTFSLTKPLLIFILAGKIHPLATAA